MHGKKHAHTSIQRGSARWAQIEIKYVRLPQTCTSEIVGYAISRRNCRTLPVHDTCHQLCDAFQIVQVIFQVTLNCIWGRQHRRSTGGANQCSPEPSITILFGTCPANMVMPGFKSGNSNMCIAVRHRTFASRTAILRHSSVLELARESGIVIHVLSKALPDGQDLRPCNELNA